LDQAAQGQDSLTPLCPQDMPDCFIR
jgi:hypothetical protein